MLKLFDLPAHTFFVHAPVVLIPLVSLAAAAIAVKNDWRRRYGWLVLGGAVATVIATWLAVSSGQAFDEFLDGAVPTARHEQLAQQTMILVILLAAVVVGLVLGGRRADRRAGDGGTSPASRRAAIALAALTITLAAAATVWVARTGHEGTRITWTGIFPEEEAGG